MWGGVDGGWAVKCLGNGKPGYIAVSAGCQVKT